MSHSTPSNTLRVINREEVNQAATTLSHNLQLSGQQQQQPDSSAPFAPPSTTSTEILDDSISKAVAMLKDSPSVEILASETSPSNKSEESLPPLPSPNSYPFENERVDDESDTDGKGRLYISLPSGML